MNAWKGIEGGLKMFEEASRNLKGSNVIKRDLKEFIGIKRDYNV